MSDELLIPYPPGTPRPAPREKRYTTNHDVTDWDGWEEQILWGVLPHCVSLKDYTDTCVTLLRTLKREPQDAEPGTPEYEAHCRKNVQNRMVTRHMDDDERWTFWAERALRLARVRRGWNGGVPERAGLPLTWADHHLIGSYWRKPHNGESPVPLGEFLELLGRDPDADAGPVRAELELMRRHNGPRLDEGRGRLFRTVRMWHYEFVNQLKQGQPAAWSSLRYWAAGRERPEPVSDRDD